MGAAAAQEPVEDRFFAQLPNEVKVAAETEATSEDQARQEADARVAKLKARQEAKAEAARLKAEQKAKAEAEKQAAAEARAAKLKAKQEAKAEAARLKAGQKAQPQAEKPVAAEAKRAAEPEAQAAVAHAEAEKKVKAEELPTAAAKQTAEAEAARVNAEKKALADTQAAAGGSADKPKAQSSKEEDFAKDVAGLKTEQKAQIDTKAADEAKAAKLKAAKSDMLIDFVQKAVLQNPDVLTRWHNFQAAVNETSAARGVFLPRVDMAVDSGREKPQSVFANNTANTKNITFTLTQMLYDGFATLNDVRRLNNAQLARYYELLDASETAALEATRAFYDMSRQRKLFELTEDNYVRHRTAFEQIKLKVEAGVGRRVDLEQAAGRLALSESNLVLDNANVHDVSARFQRMIGVLPPAKMRISPSQAKLAKQVLPNAASAVLSIAVDYHPAILAAVENVRSARYDLYGRWAKYQPTVNLVVAQTHSKNLGGDPTLGAGSNSSAKVMLNWNLYSGGSDSARSSQYVGRLDSARDLRDKACRDIRMTLAIAYNDISKLTEQLKFLDQHQLSIEKALAAYQKQFDIGQRSLLDLLDTENELYQAKRSYTNAEYDLAIAYARTIAGMGRLVSSLGIAHLETKDLPELLGTSSDAAENCPMDAPLANNIRLEELDARAIEQAKAANEAARAKEEAGKEQKAKEDNAFLMTPGEARAAKAKEAQGVKAGGELKAGQDAKAGEAELAKLKAEQEAQAAAEEKAKQAAEAKAAKIKARQEDRAEAARLKAEQKAKAQAEKQAAAEAKRAAEAEAARLKAEQKAKAEAEKRGAAEEKAKQEAEVRVAKLKAKEEAKAEAARVKAEQEAKAQAEKQAQQEAKAEAARVKAEQTAKTEAEKQVAAEEKAKQEAEVRVAKLKAKEEAKAEAARVKAEQEAKAQAEK
ncbi:MAG: TolC family outer membrane protein, partial [Gallionella sp.]|nr:TolC family outer membrane protein [Gallionella sp.]